MTILIADITLLDFFAHSLQELEFTLGWHFTYLSAFVPGFLQLRPPILLKKTLHLHFPFVLVEHIDKAIVAATIRLKLVGLPFLEHLSLIVLLALDLRDYFGVILK